MLIMNGKFFIRLFFLLCVFIISQDVDAQYKFYVSMSFNYNCHGNRECDKLVSMTNDMIQKALSGIPISLNTKNECEAARNITVNILNEAKSLASQYASRYGVKFNFTVTPCSGFGGGNFVFLGPNRGSSFYSPSVVDEIKNWSEDNERLQAALNPEWERSEQMAVETSDYSFDEERKNLREGFVIDTDKPFVSLNMRERWRSPDLDNQYVELEYLKLSKGLKYNSIDDFTNDMVSKSLSMQNYILEVADMSSDVFKTNIIDVANYIERWYNEQNMILSKSLENAEEKYDIANFLCEYKGYLTNCYKNSMSDPAADFGHIEAFGKTRDELLYENIAKLETELKDKYNLKNEDIEKLKKNIDDDNIVQEFLLKIKELDVSESIENLQKYKDYTPKTKNKSILERVIDKADTYENAVDLGVLANDNIALWGLKKSRDACANAVKSIKDNQEIIKNVRNNEIQKINDLLQILENSSQKNINEVLDMSNKDKLEWSKRTLETIERIQLNNSHDKYNVFPDRFSNLYIKKVRNIESR